MKEKQTKKIKRILLEMKNKMMEIWNKKMKNRRINKMM